MKHELKLLTEFFDDVVSGVKSFELRRNDRGFKCEDVLVLNEFCNKCEEPYYTGRHVEKTVVYILQGGNYGLESDYVILGIK